MPDQDADALKSQKRDRAIMIILSLNTHPSKEVMVMIRIEKEGWSDYGGDGSAFVVMPRSSNLHEVLSAYSG